MADQRGSRSEHSRGFTPRFAVTIGSQTVGYIKSVKGGDWQAELEKLDPSTDNHQRKIVHGLKVTPFEIDIAMGMSRHMTDWIVGTINKQATRMHGEVVVGNHNLESVVSQEFFEALISEIGFPALTGDGKQSAFLKVKFDPEEVHFKQESGAPIQGLLNWKTKELSDRDWDFLIDQGNLPTGICTKVDAFTVKQEVVADHHPSGGGRTAAAQHFADKIPGKLEIGEITAEYSMTRNDISKWQSWAKDWMLRGMRGEKSNKTGAIIYRAKDGSEMARLDLEGIGLVEFGVNEAKGGANSSYKFKTKFFVEHVKIHMPAIGS